MPDAFDATLFDQIADGIAEHGYAVIKSALPVEVMAQLKARISSLGDQELSAASIGRGSSKQRADSIRNDQICWLDDGHPVDQIYLKWMEQLRNKMNQQFFMGLFDYEAHYAIYQSGDFYKKHVDALKGSRNRVLSTVFYLNENWQAGDGGALQLFSDQDQLLETLLPEYGTMVIFLSEDFPHEVQPAQRQRHSIAGWFRVSNSY